MPSLHEVSDDPRLPTLIRLTDGRRLTAVQFQLEYPDQARKFVEDLYGTDADPTTR